MKKDTWLPLAEAAQLLGKSDRQLARRVEQRFVRKKVLPREPGQSAATALYSAADIEAVNSGTPNYYPPEDGAAVALRVLNAPRLALNGSRDTNEDAPPEFRVANPRPWLTLDEASEYSGLPTAFLRRAAGGEVVSLDVGPPSRPEWRFHRDSLGDAPETMVAAKRKR